MVPEGRYFAMGDNRTVSLDGRYWGFVPRANIVGRPLFVYWSFIEPDNQYEKEGVGDKISVLYPRDPSLLRSDPLAPNVPSGPLAWVAKTKRPSPRRWILLAALVLAVVAFVLPPLVNINRYQHRIADSISRSIGRQVHISSVKLRLLPLPGFEFSDFSVEEDPQFGSEPILHSSSVVAYLRLLSLWRGRLEVSRIHFDDASLNLVREPNGGWNFASVLVQAAHIPNAPTGQRYAGSAPRFPYIEAENTRINFKQGNEKKPLSFLNSDLSISLAPGDEWELHFRAQPVRTDLDLDLADTGVLRIDGTLHRAAWLGEMPLNLKVEWSGVPLGQLSRLTLGRDIGWRGGLEVEAQVSGTAELAQINTSLKVAGLHRSEFSPARPMDVATSCRASFRKETRSLEDISCASPVGDGALRLTGVHTGSANPAPGATSRWRWIAFPRQRCWLGCRKCAAAWAPGCRPPARSMGISTTHRKVDRQPLITGEVALASLSLTPPDAGKPFLLGPVRVKCDSPETGPPALVLQPVRLAMGAPAPVTVDGRFTSAGFDLHLSGSTSLARLQAFNKPFGLLGAHSTRPPAVGAASVVLGGAGTAALDLDVRGKWLLPVPDSEHPIASSTAEGSIAIRNAELTTSYLSQPLRIASAQGILSPTQIAWTNASLSYGKLEAQGTLEYPTLCTGQRAVCGAFLARSLRRLTWARFNPRCWAPAKAVSFCASFSIALTVIPCSGPIFPAPSRSARSRPASWWCMTPSVRSTSAETRSRYGR